MELFFRFCEEHLGLFTGGNLDNLLQGEWGKLLKSALYNILPVRFFASRFFISSPIILDLDGDGVETMGVEEDGSVFFDFNGDGRQSLTGWVGKDDGLLVFDRNGDGIINDDSELFGNNTARYNGLGKCIHGFEALAQEDSNGDGLVNHLDDNWQHLKVWCDLNQDGITNEGESFARGWLYAVDV